jgi:hypothetical protein
LSYGFWRRDESNDRYDNDDDNDDDDGGWLASLDLPVRYIVCIQGKMFEDPSMPLGLAGLRELIRRPPAAAAATVRPFYSNFDWLD